MTTVSSRFWREGKGGLRVLARVTPKSSRDGVEGVTESAQGPALTVRVRAVAGDGEANRAVEAVVAKWLGVAKGCVSVAAGGKSRIKTLDIAGNPEALASLMHARVAELQ